MKALIAETVYIITPSGGVFCLGGSTVAYAAHCSLEDLDELDLVQIKLYMLPLQQCVQKKGFKINECTKIFLNGQQISVAA